MAAVGSMIKELRRRRGLAMRDLAKRSGVSHSTISLIERDQLSPSVDTLGAILEALGSTLAGFFSQIEAEVTCSPFYKGQDLVEIGRSDAISHRMVGSGHPNRHLLMLHETYAPGADTGQASSHAAHEAGVVTRGRVEVTVGSESRVLESGMDTTSTAACRIGSAMLGPALQRSSAPSRPRPTNWAPVKDALRISHGFRLPVVTRSAWSRPRSDLDKGVIRRLNVASSGVADIMNLPSEKSLTKRVAFSTVIALSLLASGRVRADPFDAYRIACKREQRSIVERSVSAARDMLTASNRALPPGDSTIGRKFKRWFGGPEGDADPLLKRSYAEIQTFLGFKQFWCPNKSLPTDRPRRIAFVPKGSFSEIFLAAPFFSLHDSGADSKAGTIVHELSHQSTINPTSDQAYGVADAEQLARTRWHDARRNADNVEYFAEDVHYGVP